MRDFGVPGFIARLADARDHAEHRRMGGPMESGPKRVRWAVIEASARHIFSRNSKPTPDP